MTTMDISYSRLLNCVEEYRFCCFFPFYCQCQLLCCDDPDETCVVSAFAAFKSASFTAYCLFRIEADVGHSWPVVEMLFRLRRGLLKSAALNNLSVIQR